LREKAVAKTTPEANSRRHRVVVRVILNSTVKIPVGFPSKRLVFISCVGKTTMGQIPSFSSFFGGSEGGYNYIHQTPRALSDKALVECYITPTNLAWTSLRAEGRRWMETKNKESTFVVNKRRAL